MRMSHVLIRKIIVFSLLISKKQDGISCDSDRHARHWPSSLLPTTAKNKVYSPEILHLLVFHYVTPINNKHNLYFNWTFVAYVSRFLTATPNNLEQIIISVFCIVMLSEIVVKPTLVSHNNNKINSCFISTTTSTIHLYAYR